MKKNILLLALLLFAIYKNAYASDIFNHPISAEDASKKMPVFENKTCKFTQNKYLTSSKINLTSGGNFQFIKDKGVNFETTYPIQAKNSYTTADNKQINSIVKAVVNKNFSYIEKNFDLYYMPLNSSQWIFALKPKSKSPLNKSLKSLCITGENINNSGIITKMTISTENNTTTISFTQCA